MIRLNGIGYDYRPGITLKELTDDFSAAHRKVGFEGFVIIVNGAALTVEQAKEKTLNDNDVVFIVPVMDGG